MSISKYVKTLTAEQLDILIDCANKRKVEIKSEGHVVVYGVFGGQSTKWFDSKESADGCFLIAAKEALSDNYPEVSMEKRRIELHELAEYLGSEKAKEIIAQGLLIIKPAKEGAA
jgi:hypothetical protein